MARGERKPPPTARDIAQVVHRMAQGESLAGVAGELGKAVAPIRQVLMDLGYPTRPAKPAPPVILKEDVEAELAKLGTVPPAPVSRLPGPKPALDPDRVPAGPLRAKLQDARLHGRGVSELGRAVATIMGEIREPRHDSLIRNILGGQKTVTRTDAVVLAEVLHLAPAEIWADWVGAEAVSA